tara:strand:+ start:243 stop:512 length:270 start_codon:yes stop_codon:yes gene_type:complete
MDKELDENIKPVEPKSCCYRPPAPPDPNCCRPFKVNTLPAGTTPKMWNSLSHKEKYEFAITHNWEDIHFNYLRESQPEYDPNKQNFEPR